MDNFFLNHIEDLSEKSRKNNCFVFSDFLTPDEISAVKADKKINTPMTFHGGAEGAERMMVRFGSEEELYYTEDFPVTCIKAEPLNMKFSDALTHRDFLGAVMNLSVARNKIGDIVIRDNIAYIFVHSKIAPFITGNLKKVKHTHIKCSETLFESSESLFRLEEKIILSTSLRADCVISSVYNLSRKITNELFISGKVFINSSQCENSSHQLKPDDTVSVRGFGKFIFISPAGTTKKDRLKLKISIYI